MASPRALISRVIENLCPRPGKHPGRPGGPRTGHMSAIVGLVLAQDTGLSCQTAERLGDHLIPVPGRVLVDHRRGGVDVLSPVTGDASVGLGPRGKTVDGNNDHHNQDNCDDNRKDDHSSSAHRESFPSAVPYHDPARPTTPYSCVLLPQRKVAHGNAFTGVPVGPVRSEPCPLRARSRDRAEV